LRVFVACSGMKPQRVGVVVGGGVGGGVQLQPSDLSTVGSDVIYALEARSDLSRISPLDNPVIQTLICCFKEQDPSIGVVQEHDAFVRSYKYLIAVCVRMWQ
jgi:hypothetical protein